MSLKRLLTPLFEFERKEKNNKELKKGEQPPLFLFFRNQRRQG
jgi:hypothetical protein